MDVRQFGSMALVVLACVADVAAADHEARLVDAVKAGNRAAIRALLKQPAEINKPELDGSTSLHWAVRADDLETVQALLRAGANPKVTNRYGLTPLGLAAINGNPATLELLLKAGADPNTALPEGETALMTAARTGTVEALKVLLAHGANVNAREAWLGETALMWAVAENHPAAVQLLIEAGADINTRSAASSFPRVSPPIENLITMTLPQGGWTSLMYAARQGALSAARVLADAGADLNVASPDGSTALILAIINAHYDVAGLLLEKGADPNRADTTGMAALYAAVDMRTLPWMQGRPAPQPSGQLEALDLVKLLLVRQANPNAPLTAPLLQRHHTAGDPNLGAGTTPLLRAAKYSDVPVMRVLLEHGANPHVMQKNHTTVLMIAAALGVDRVTDEFFNDYGTERDAIEAIRLSLERGVDLKAFNDNGDTALHRAVGGDVIRFLVQRGADLHVKNKQGLTPLEAALARRDRNGAIRFPAAVAALKALTGPAAETHQGSANTKNP